jgi:hypothetical protein
MLGPSQCFLFFVVPIWRVNTSRCVYNCMNENVITMLETMCLNTEVHDCLAMQEREEGQILEIATWKTARRGGCMGKTWQLEGEIFSGKERAHARGVDEALGPNAPCFENVPPPCAIGLINDTRRFVWLPCTGLPRRSFLAWYSWPAAKLLLAMVPWSFKTMVSHGGRCCRPNPGLKPWL